MKCLCGSANCSGYMGGKQSDKQDNDASKDATEAEARFVAMLLNKSV